MRIILLRKRQKLEERYHWRSRFISFTEHYAKRETLHLGKMEHPPGQNLTFPLKHIIDHCLAQGKSPDCLKICKVIPSPKVATPGILNDLGTIAITPIMSRLLERILIKSFIGTNYKDEIETRRHGFRVGVSTENAVIRLQNDCRHFQSVGFDYVGIISWVFQRHSTK